jgi:hypothetical protein
MAKNISLPNVTYIENFQLTLMLSNGLSLFFLINYPENPAQRKDCIAHTITRPVVVYRPSLELDRKSVWVTL